MLFEFISCENENSWYTTISSSLIFDNEFKLMEGFLYDSL